MMTVVFNDFSLNGQFTTTDEFAEYVRSVLLDVLTIMADRKIPLLSSVSTYECRVTKDTNLSDLLYSRNNDPVFTKLKIVLVSLINEPYWNNDSCTQTDVIYDYPFCGGNQQNCFTEAISRRSLMLSISPCKYGRELECRENDLCVKIINVFNKNELLEEVLKDSCDLKYVLNTYDFGMEMQTVSIDGKCFSEEALNACTVPEDCFKLLEASKWIVNGIKTNTKNHYSDHIEKDIYELRATISDSREFRLFFILRNGINFINGFVKKTQKTPPSEIDKAKTIRKMCANTFGW